MLILIAIGKKVCPWTKKMSYGRGHGCGHGLSSLNFFPNQNF